MVILKPITNRREIKSYPLDSVPLANPWGSTGPGSGFTVEEHSNARNSDSSCIRGHGRLPGDRRCGSAAGIQRRSLNRFKAAQLIAASLASKFFRCAPGATDKFPVQVCGIPPPTPNLHRNVRGLPSLRAIRASRSAVPRNVHTLMLLRSTKANKGNHMRIGLQFAPFISIFPVACRLTPAGDPRIVRYDDENDRK